MQPRLLDAVEAVNDAQKGHLFELMQRHYDPGEDEGLRGKTIAVWGLAFKPNTDDMREASSRRLLQQLWDAGVKVRAYDPEAMDETRRIFGGRDDLVLCESAATALQGADALDRRAHVETARRTVAHGYGRLDAEYDFDDQAVRIARRRTPAAAWGIDRTHGSEAIARGHAVEIVA